MTLASHRPTPSRENGSASDGRPVSDFHLVEDANGWRLTVNVTDRLRQLLCAAPDSAGEAPADFTVHVEPNLLPGDPFAVTIAALSDHG
jgi:hypothetical protein